MAEPTSKNALSLEDRLAIAETIARYCHCVDRGRWDEFPDLFTADGKLDLRPLMGVYEGRDAIRTGFCDVLKPVPITMRHLTSNLVVTGSGDAAHAECYVLAITSGEGMPTQQMTGFYDDELVRDGGRWRFRSRRVMPDVPKS
ncbi:MAG: nuclear transport factor 2 family protein [Alphaproteobacteria bacterium]